jgi:hypothetical protein
MKIYLQFNNSKKIFKTNPYESIKSIIYNFIDKNKINDDYKNYFLEFNGLYLYENDCLEKYNIQNNSVINVNQKKKGGNSIIKYAMDNPWQFFICILISLLPIFILPLGFISILSSFIKIIIEKSFYSIGKYLVCNYGKITLFHRIKFLITIIKYIIFILIIFVIITFPILLLCLTIKGYSITDNPQNMCSPLKTSNLTGLILTIFFVIIYFSYRCGNYIIQFLITICKKVYVLNMIFVPSLKYLLTIYDDIKYIPVIYISSGSILRYFDGLKYFVESSQSFLLTIKQFGCQTNYNNNNNNKKSFSKEFLKNIQNSNILKNNNKRNSDNNNNEFMCQKDLIQCCSPENFLRIGNLLKKELENEGNITITLKDKSLYPVSILLTQGIYEEALKNVVNKNERESIQKNINQLEFLQNQFSKNDNSVYIQGETLFKTTFKYIFINIFCNLTYTSNTSIDVFHEMGEITEIVDMIKASTSTGIIMSFIYIITYIVLIFAGIFNYY